MDEQTKPNKNKYINIDNRIVVIRGEEGWSG